MRPTHPRGAARSARPPRRPRRGSALVLVLVLTMGLAALAMSAIYLSSHAQLVARSFEREADYSYAADAGVAMGRSRLDVDAWALPDTGFVTLHSNAAIQDADNVDIPSVRVNVWVGPTGSVGQSGQRFGSIVAEAMDGNGSRFIRHLEVTRESFAKFAYFSNLENRPDGSVIVFGGGDVLNGPVWSNDTIQIHSSGAAFLDSVGTAGVIVGRSNGTFTVPPVERVRRIEMPSTASLSSLRSHASVSGFLFTGLRGGTTDSASKIRHRIEFVNVDLDGDGDATDEDEGFFKFYDTHDTLSGTLNRTPLTSGGRGTYYTAHSWLRADSIGQRDSIPRDRDLAANRIPDIRNVDNCGDWHREEVTGRYLFFPAALHDTTGWGALATPSASVRHAWFYNWMVANEVGLNRRFGEATNAAARVRAHMAATSDPLSVRIGGSATTRRFWAVDSVLGAPPTQYVSTTGGARTNFSGGIVYPQPRCFPGGDPHLVAIERNYLEGVNPFAPSPFTAGTGWPYSALDWQKGGSDSTFTPAGSRGQWRRWTGAVDGRVRAARPWDADYLFPISRVLNGASRGVIYTDASVGVSGTLRGRVTLHSAGGIVLLDDQMYATDPSSPTRACADVLGMISDQNVNVAYNGILTPVNVTAYNPAVAARWRTLGSPAGGTVGVSVHSIVLTRNTSFEVESFASRPSAADAGTTSGLLTCNGANVGRGCLRLWGGLIQERRGAVGTSSGVGYIKQYGYDICGASNPPPYFPTTGRYAENRYTEVDPVTFEVGRFFRERTPERAP